MVILMHTDESHSDPLSILHEHNLKQLLPLNQDVQARFRERSHTVLSSLLVTWREVLES